MTPACIQALCHVPPADKSNPTNAMGIYEEDFGGITYTQQSLYHFFADFAPYIPRYSPVRGIGR